MKISTGFICKQLKLASERAKEINRRIRKLVNIAHCVMDEIWIKVVKVSKDWTYGFLRANPKSLFIWGFDFVDKRDEATMGVRIDEDRTDGLNPKTMTSDLLKVYRNIAKDFKNALHQLCTNHGRNNIYRILDELPREAKEDKFFYEYLVKIKERFFALFNLDDFVEIELEVKQILKELRFFQPPRKEWARPMLDFIQNHWYNLFLYKRYPGEGIENTNNGAEMIFSLFKPSYKIMKHLQKDDTAQGYFEGFTLRNNFRIFERGKRKGFSPIQLEGIPTDITDWTQLIWGENPERLLEEIEKLALINQCQKGENETTKLHNEFFLIEI